MVPRPLPQPLTHRGQSPPSSVATPLPHSVSLIPPHLGGGHASPPDRLILSHPCWALSFHSSFPNSGGHLQTRPLLAILLELLGNVPGLSFPFC